MKKIKLLTFALATLVAGFVMTSCEKDGEIQIPEISFETTTFEISETSTTALAITVSSDIPAPQDITVNFNVTGTAVSGVNYVALTSNSITIDEGDTEATLLINPINVPAIEANKTIIITLTAANDYDLAGADIATTITILDNNVAPNDAPVVQFTSGDVIKNAYLEDTVKVTLGLDVAFDAATLIPLELTGDAVEDTDFEILDLNSNNEIEFAAGETSAEFRVVTKFTNVADLDVDIDVAFADPVTTEYVIASSNTEVNINLIDPTVQNVWFLDRAAYNDATGNEAIVLANDGTERIYDTDGSTLPSMVYDGVYGPYTKRQKEDDSWTSASPYAYLTQDGTDVNLWRADWSFTILNKDDEFDTTPFYPYYNTYIPNSYDIKDFFPSSYLVGYPSAGVKIEEFLRLVATVADGTTGKVIIPEQVVQGYRSADGYEWKGKTDGGVDPVYSYAYGDQYNYKIESHTSLGVIENSTSATPVNITISGEGTFDVNTKLILVTLTITSDDPNFTPYSTGNTVNFRITPLKADYDAIYD